MHSEKLIAYYRVSTQRQVVSGLGLDAQKEAVEALARARRARISASYSETESGAHDKRPQLERALHHAKVTGATLVIAKLDRLSRNAVFLLQLRDSGARFVAADVPDASDLTVGILALVAEQEREAISRRTREALAAAKKRGVRLGNPHGARALRRAGKGNTAALVALACKADAYAKELKPVVASLLAEGRTSLSQLRDGLNGLGVLTPRGGDRWHKTTVSNLLARIESIGTR